MRHLCFFLLLLTYGSVAQDTTRRVDRDPVFMAVLARQLGYPLNAEGAYARIYAGFSIDEKGRVRNIAILNPVKIGYGFEEEVVSSLKRLPSLNPRYVGDYVLPVSFVYVNYEKNASETIPEGTLPAWYFANRTVLPGIRRENGKPFRNRATKYMWLRNLNSRSN